MPEDKIEPLDKIESLLDLITHIGRIQGKCWWRGVKDAEKHKLIPGVFREKEDREQETNKIRLFQEMAPARFGKCPSDDAQLNWLFLMQHYRLQTRLLDWSKSPFIATFFAVSNNKPDEKEEDAALWYLSPKKLNNFFFPDAMGGEFLPNSNLIIEVYKGAFLGQPGKPMYNPKVAAIMPKQIDTRMLLQMSRFTIHGAPCPLEEYEELKDCFHKIIIPSDRKGGIKTELAYLGITDSNLFPDLDNLAGDLNQNLFEAF